MDFSRRVTQLAQPCALIKFAPCKSTHWRSYLNLLCFLLCHSIRFRYWLFNTFLTKAKKKRKSSRLLGPRRVPITRRMLTFCSNRKKYKIDVCDRNKKKHIGTEQRIATNFGLTTTKCAYLDFEMGIPRLEQQFLFVNMDRVFCMVDSSSLFLLICSDFMKLRKPRANTSYLFAVSDAYLAVGDVWLLLIA